MTGTPSRLTPSPDVSASSVGWSLAAGGTSEVLTGPLPHMEFKGEATAFTVSVQASGTPVFRWRKDGVDLVDDGRITGATTATLSIDPLQYADLGHYDVLIMDACGSFASAAAFLLVPPAGDMNCDGVVTFADINPFVKALTNPAGYEQRFPNCRLLQADCNDDGEVGFGDINPFVKIISGGG